MVKVFIAPRRYVQGAGVLKDIGKYVAPLGKRVLVAWGPVVSEQFNDIVKKSFEENDLVLIPFKFSGECDRGQIGLGIEKAVLFARSERARKIAERDLEIGREIQSGFFPTLMPRAEGWELATHFQAARHVAGDFYDVFTLGEDNKIAIVIADVCDKGVGAALFMALFRSFIRVLSGSANSNGQLDIAGEAARPDDILQHTISSINNYISITHEQAGMFATIFYGILDPQNGELTYINGGHEPPIIKGPEGIKTNLSPTGPAVGLYPNLDFKIRSITLQPEDTLLIYTDGVTDAQNTTGEAFTKKRLTKIAENSSRTAQDLIHKIKARIDEHILGADQFDDITIVVLRRK